MNFGGTVAPLGPYIGGGCWCLGKSIPAGVRKCGEKGSFFSNSLSVGFAGNSMLSAEIKPYSSPQEAPRFDRGDDDKTMRRVGYLSHMALFTST